MTTQDGAASVASLRTLEVTICVPCLYGRGGECHTPGCAFWVCPAPSAEQAEALRRQPEVDRG